MGLPHKIPIACVGCGNADKVTTRISKCLLLNSNNGKLFVLRGGGDIYGNDHSWPVLQTNLAFEILSRPFVSIVRGHNTQICHSDLNKSIDMMPERLY